jgi:hypothetical protein
VATSSATTQIYSAYAGPALATHVGDVAVNGSCWVGYTSGYQERRDRRCRAAQFQHLRSFAFAIGRFRQAYASA